MVNTSRTLATGTFLRTAVNGRSRAAPSLGVESLKFRQKYCWPFFQKPFSSVILTFSTSASFGHWLAKLCWWWHCVLWRDEQAFVLFERREFRFLTSPLHPHSSWKVAKFIGISQIVIYGPIWWLPDLITILFSSSQCCSTLFWSSFCSYWFS